jgi:hypothetical protein
MCRRRWHDDAGRGGATAFAGTGASAPRRHPLGCAVMKSLCLVSAACGTKKPAAQQPAPPPPAEDQGKKPDAAPAPQPAVTPGISDPCDGGQKPH